MCASFVLVDVKTCCEELLLRCKSSKETSKRWFDVHSVASSQLVNELIVLVSGSQILLKWGTSNFSTRAMGPLFRASIGHNLIPAEDKRDGGQAVPFWKRRCFRLPVHPLLFHYLKLLAKTISRVQEPEEVVAIVAMPRYSRLDTKKTFNCPYCWRPVELAVSYSLNLGAVTGFWI